jgi:hypothetical protein
METRARELGIIADDGGSLAFKYKIHGEIGFTYIKVWGEIGAADEQQMIEAVVGDPAFTPNMRILVDRRESTMNVRFQDAKQFVVHVKAMQEIMGHPIIAVVVGGQLDYGLQRMFQSLSDGVLSHEYGIFQSVEEARAWLKIKVEKENMI